MARIVEPPPVGDISDDNGDATSPASQEGVSCVSSGPRVKFVYVYPPQAGWDRAESADLEQRSKRLISRFGNTFGWSSVINGGPRDVKIRMDCELAEVPMERATWQNTSVEGMEQLRASHFAGNPNDPDGAAGPALTEEELMQMFPAGGMWTRAQIAHNFGRLRALLEKNGMNEPGVRYAVILETTGFYVGYGGRVSDRSTFSHAVVSANWPDFGAAMTHEILHSFGAIADGSPNSASGHCNDYIDQLCRRGQESVDTWKRVLTYVERCSEEGVVCGRADFHGVEEVNCMDVRPQMVDCGGDDYFNPNPKPGSWLASNSIENLATPGGWLEVSGENRCNWRRQNRFGTLSCAVGTIRSLEDEDRSP